MTSKRKKRIRVSADARGHPAFRRIMHTIERLVPGEMDEQERLQEFAELWAEYRGKDPNVQEEAAEFVEDMFRALGERPWDLRL